MRIAAAHSCGDCGHLGSYEDHEAHLTRPWHRAVRKLGLDAALDSPAAKEPDARRAIHIFREGGAP